MRLFVGHDVGTSGTKSALLDETGRVYATALSPHALDTPAPGRVEQDPESWLAACGANTRALLREARVDGRAVAGVAFAGQMLTLVPLDRRGQATRPAIAWMDDRAEAQARAIVRRFGGTRVLRWIAGATPTGKDIVAKVAWMREHEPEAFAATTTLGDATSWLVARTTGVVGIDPTAVAATGLLDLRTRRLVPWLTRLAGLRPSLFPDIAPSTSVAGRLHADGAAALGLPEGTLVATGLADIPALALGTGATRPGQAHVYLGTSAWIARATSEPTAVPSAGVAAIPSGDVRGCLAVGESEAAGAGRAWVRRLLGVGSETELDALAERSPPGARGVVFAPWLAGERAPFPDATLRGGLAHLALEHGPADVARAVLEGVALNLRCVLDAMDAGSDAATDATPLPVAGGGAESDVWLQILADVLDRALVRVSASRFAGAHGAALVAAVAAGAVPGVAALAGLVPRERTFVPRREHRAIYDAAVQSLRALVGPLSRPRGRP